MSRFRRLLRARVRERPFRLANLVVLPLGIMFGGCFRVWSTARTPFEEFSGVLLVIAVALLWALCFGILGPRLRTVKAE